MSDHLPLEVHELIRSMPREDLAAIERIVQEATRSWREAIARGDFKPTQRNSR